MLIYMNLHCSALPLSSASASSLLQLQVKRPSYFLSTCKSSELGRQPMKSRGAACNTSHVNWKGGGGVAANQSGVKALLGDVTWAKLRNSSWWPAQVLKQNNRCCREIFQKALKQEHLQLKAGTFEGARLRPKDMSASKDKKSNQTRAKRSMETGASNHISDAANAYYGGGVRITRAMKAGIEVKCCSKTVSGKGEAQLGSKKISSLTNGPSVRTSPRTKSASTEQDGQHKKQNPTTSAAEQTKGTESISNQNKVHKELKRSRSSSTANEKNDMAPKHDKVVKKYKPSPPSYEPSERQVRVMRSLGLAAPLGSPFRKK